MNRPDRPRSFPSPTDPAAVFVSDGAEIFARRWRYRDGTNRLLRLTAPPSTFGDVKLKLWSMDGDEPIRWMGSVTVMGRDIPALIAALRRHAGAAGLDCDAPDPGRAVNAFDVLFADHAVENIIE